MCRQWHGIRGFHGIITFNVTSPWHHLIEFFWNTTHINTTREALFRLKKKTAYLATLREHLAAQCAICRLGGFGRLQDCKWSWSCFPSSSAGNNENDEHFRHHYFQCNITAETPCRGNPPRLPRESCETNLGQKSGMWKSGTIVVYVGLERRKMTSTSEAVVHSQVAKADRRFPNASIPCRAT